MDALAASAMAPVLGNVAALAALAVGGSLHAAVAGALPRGRSPPRLRPRGPAGRRTPPRLAPIRGDRRHHRLGGSLFLAPRMGAMAAMIDHAALPIFLAMAIATMLPTLLWRGTSGAGALAGMAIAGVWPDRPPPHRDGGDPDRAAAWPVGRARRRPLRARRGRRGQPAHAAASQRTANGEGEWRRRRSRLRSTQDGAFSAEAQRTGLHDPKRGKAAKAVV